EVFADLELLEIEMDLLWPSDAPELVVASGRDGLRARLSSRVPTDLASQIMTDALRQRSSESGMPPERLEHWRTTLQDALGAPISLAPGSGPSYLIHEGVDFDTTELLVRSNTPQVGQLREANPGNWRNDEWLELLEGRLGPWAMATHGSRVVSICHTPVANARAAEAGLWTDPEFRGRGLGAASTAAWAALMRPT